MSWWRAARSIGFGRHLFWSDHHHLFDLRFDLMNAWMVFDHHPTVQVFDHHDHYQTHHLFRSKFLSQKGQHPNMSTHPCCSFSARIIWKTWQIWCHRDRDWASASLGPQMERTHHFESEKDPRNEARLECTSERLRCYKARKFLTINFHPCSIHITYSLSINHSIWICKCSSIFQFLTLWWQVIRLLNRAGGRAI